VVALIVGAIPCGCPYLDNAVDGEIGVYGDGKAAFGVVDKIGNL